MFKMAQLVLLSCLLSFIQNAQSITLIGGYNTLPKPLYGSLVAVNSQNEVIIIGGCDAYTQCGHVHNTCGRDTQRSSAIYAWDTQHSSIFTEIQSPTAGIAAWNPSSGFPFPIHQDIMYIPWDNVMYKYDTINKQWSENVTVMPVPLSYPCTVYDQLEHKIYLLGGVNIINAIEQWIFYSTVQIYDIATDSWEMYFNTAPIPDTVYGGSCVLSGRSIYYFGGRNGKFSISSNIWKYQIDDNKWTQIFADIGNYTFGTAAFIGNEGEIFLFGGAQMEYTNLYGCSGGFWRLIPSDKVYQFNRNDESSHLITKMNYGRFAPLAALVHDRLWVSGGFYLIPWFNMWGISVETEMSLQTKGEWNYSQAATTNSPTNLAARNENSNITTTETKLDTTTTLEASSVSSDKHVPSNLIVDSDNNEVLKIVMAILSTIIVFLLVIFVLVYKYQQKTKQNVASVKEHDVRQTQELVNRDGSDNGDVSVDKSMI